MPGIDLSDRDVRAMMHIAREYAGAGTPSEILPQQLLSDLRDLIACDQLWVSGQDSAHQTQFAIQQAAANPEQDDEVHVFWQHYWDCLPCSYPDRSGDLVAVTMISDFYSTRTYHDSGMYVDYLGPRAVEHEIMVCLPAGPGRSLRFLFNRDGGADFTERDRAVLTLLRPHLKAAYVAAQRRRQGLAELTQRQQEILQYVAAGYSNDQIGRRLELSPATVRKHLENIFARLDVTSRTAAVTRVGLDVLG